ncbi:hypothetical protein GCM10010909_17780 [Acidocella aquatica]|uniref:Uncharacterized protein n=2 Tax=Acidocella aquatica TaxID=1922313 RepID=A0ABQ6A602_9PROT|nr:hypothetical protein GCM10010909_17780 [Acidocella aquatica]
MPCGNRGRKSKGWVRAMLAFGCAWLVGPAFGKDAERAFAFPPPITALEEMKGRKNDKSHAQ